ncbi:ABC transporter permease [Propionibacteriaceae bacterium Y1923]
MNIANLHTMLAIQWRTGWKVLVAWVAATVALMGITGVAMDNNYDTPETIAAYAATVGSGPAIKMLNGNVAGLDTLGGILANEFGFIASFMLPIMGIALVSRSTRREEEAGRLELLLASAIGRHAPLVASLLLATAAAAATGLGCWAVTRTTAVDSAGAAWYSAALAVLLMFFAGVAAVAAQVVESNRGVWMIGLGVAVVAFLVRGLGAVNEAWYVWLSPLGLFDGVRAFGEARWWPPAVSLLVSLLLVGLALLLNARRDLGAALVRSRPGRPRASAGLRTGWGLAVFEHRAAVIGWAIGAAVVMAIYGSLAQQVVDAVGSIPELQAWVNAALDAIMAMFVMMASMLAAATGIALGGSLRTAEVSGRLEAVLAGPRSRTGWIVRHLAVISLASLLVLAVGAVVLAASASVSLGDDRLWSDILRATAAHAPVVLAFSGLGVLLFSVAPRLRGWLWAVFGVSAFMAYMATALRLPDWLADNSPFLVVGEVPAEPVRWVGVAVMGAVALAAHVLAVVGFRHRNLPAL